MEKCINCTWIHYVEEDTDSLYFAISDDKNEGIKQDFKHIIVDGKFYNENVSKWFPSDAYSMNNPNPIFDNTTERQR
jgi:hypothetical protein